LYFILNPPPFAHYLLIQKQTKKVSITPFV